MKSDEIRKWAFLSLLAAIVCLAYVSDNLPQGSRAEELVLAPMLLLMALVVACPTYMRCAMALLLRAASSARSGEMSTRSGFGFSSQSDGELSHSSLALLWKLSSV